MTNELGDGPIEAAYIEEMNEIARWIDRHFNGDAKRSERATGFILLVFPFGEKEGRCNYISNGADRRDVITLFTEQIARLKGSPNQTGHG